jgi:hypothetical protein
MFADAAHAVVPDRLYECAIELPDDLWLYCALEFRHSKTIPPRGGRLIGARFAELTLAQSQLVGRCISELEREYIRKRAAD